MARSISSSVLRRSDRLIMVTAVILAAVAAVLVFLAVNNNGDDTAKTVTPSGATTVVVTAARDIPARTKLSADMLQTTAVTAEQVLTGNYATTETVVGLTTRYPLLTGEQVTASKIGEAQKDDKSLALVVPPGHRAISIPVDQKTFVGGMLLPGDVVDVIAVFNDNGIFKSVTLLQAVDVLAVAQEAQKPIPPSADPAAAGGAIAEVPDDVEQQTDASTVTLSVAPDQAQLLALTEQHSTLWLSLRPRGENAPVDIGESNLQGYGIGIPQE